MIPTLAWTLLAYPYRQSVLPGQRVTIEARVYNHAGSPQQAFVELRAPSGWKVDKGRSVTLPPHTEGGIPLTAIAPAHPPVRREVLGLAVRFAGRSLGEIAEALTDYLE